MSIETPDHPRPCAASSDMAIDPPSSDTEPSSAPSQEELDRLCAECYLGGYDMTSSTPTPFSDCFDMNCWEGDFPQSPCDFDVDCCEADDCSASCSTVCDGFVDCDKSTHCSDSHCDDIECHDAVECRDAATACFDKHCIGDHASGDLEQMAHGVLSQNGSLPQQWFSSACCCPAHLSRIPDHDTGNEFSERETQHVGSPFTSSGTTSAIKPLDSLGIGNYATHCISGSHHPHMFDSSICPNPNDMVPQNVPHCTTSGICNTLDQCGQQCNFDPAFSGCDTDCHLGVNSWANPHGFATRYQQPVAGDMKMIGSQFGHIHSYTNHAPSPSSHASPLTAGSSPITPPLNRQQTVSSTITTPDFAPAPVEGTHTCKWASKNNGVVTLCGAMFPDASSLQDHLAHSHAEPIEGSQGHGYYCCWERCHRPNEPFSQKSKLQGHFLTHSNFKNFQCPTCGKTFARQATLERHERSHRGDKPYKCKECSKSFTDTSELKTHMRTHTGEKPFKCNFPGCNFETGDSSNMSSHKLTHGGRKHKCPYPACSKSFTRPDQLKRHLKGTHKLGNGSISSSNPISPASSRALSATPS